MRVAATLFAFLSCLAAPSIAAGGPATRDAADVSREACYQRLVRRGNEPRGGRVEPGEVNGRSVVYAARFDAAGRRLVTSTRDKVRVWDVPAMEPAGRPLALPPPVAAADLSPDGTLLLTVDGENRLSVRRVGADAPLWGRRHAAGFEQAAFSPDGRTVLAIARGEKTVRLLDGTTGRETLAFTDETSDYRLRAAVSRDGARVMTCSLGPTRVWSAATGKVVSSAKPFGALFAISPGGDRVAGQAQAGEVTTYDADTGRALAETEAEERDDTQVANVRALAFSPDGRFVAISKDDLGTQVWDAATGRAASRRMRLDDDDSGEASEILFTPDGSRVILGNFNGASVWDVATATRLAVMGGVMHGRPAAVGIAVAPDGRYVAVNFGGPVELWERRR